MYNITYFINAASFITAKEDKEKGMSHSFNFRYCKLMQTTKTYTNGNRIITIPICYIALNLTILKSNPHAYISMKSMQVYNFGQNLAAGRPYILPTARTKNCRNITWKNFSGHATH